MIHLFIIVMIMIGYLVMAVFCTFICLKLRLQTFGPLSSSEERAGIHRASGYAWPLTFSAWLVWGTWVLLNKCIMQPLFDLLMRIGSRPEAQTVPQNSGPVPAPENPQSRIEVLKTMTAQNMKYDEFVEFMRIRREMLGEPTPTPTTPTQEQPKKEEPIYLNRDRFEDL